VAVITTTIRLIVMARQREIEIMQLVTGQQHLGFIAIYLTRNYLWRFRAIIAWIMITSVQQFW
jgi:cell division transport system permease protein